MSDEKCLVVNPFITINLKITKNWKKKTNNFLAPFNKNQFNLNMLTATNETADWIIITELITSFETSNLFDVFYKISELTEFNEEMVAIWPQWVINLPAKRCVPTYCNIVRLYNLFSTYYAFLYTYIFFSLTFQYINTASKTDNKYDVSMWIVWIGNSEF